MLVGVVHVVAITVDGADAELLRGAPGAGACLSLLGFCAGCPGLEQGGCQSCDCSEQGNEDQYVHEFFSYLEGLPRPVWACTGADGLVVVQ